MTEAGAAKITFRGAGEAQSLSLKHDGEAWQAQSDIAAMLDDEELSL